MPATVTLEELEAASRGRAAANRRRFTVLAVVVFVVMLTFGLLLQIQQQHLAAALHQQCLQRQANAIRSNEIWAELAAIEEHNQFINTEIRQQRLTVYRNAHLTVPVCG